MLVRMSSRPPFTPEPQKRDAQILVANCIAGEAVVRVVPSNSFDRCNYATSASDRRVHGVFNWYPSSNSRIVNSPRPGRVASPPDTPAALSSSPRLIAHRWRLRPRLGVAGAAICPLPFECLTSRERPLAWRLSCSISERSSWERCGFDASVGGIRRTRGGAPSSSAARSSCLTVDLWERSKEHLAGLATGRFCHVEFCGPVSPDPDFQHRCGSDPHRVTRSLPPASVVATPRLGGVGGVGAAEVGRGALKSSSPRSGSGGSRNRPHRDRVLS